MVKPIVKDTFFLSQKSEPATRMDLNIVQVIQHECDHLEGILI
jgi:peptide deformylase